MIKSKSVVKKLTATGVTSLGADGYKITYSKKDDSGNYVNIGNKMPTLVGEYKATLSITNSNYTPSEASVYFEITPNNTEVKVKSSLLYSTINKNNGRVSLYFMLYCI